MRELAKLIAGMATVAAISAASLVLIMNNERTAAAASQYLSVDVTTAGNERNAVGVVDSCTSVESGEAFSVDVVIMDVADIVAWEFRLEFDHDIVSVNSVDYDHFLLSYDDPSVTVSPKLLDVENPNRVFIGAGEARGTPDTGSGVLARVSMEAVSDGISPLKITSQPAFRAPRVTNSTGDFVGDADGDGLWDSGITNAQVAVNGSCESLPPIPTPPAAPGSGSGGGGGSGSSGGGSGSGTSDAGVAVIDDDPGSGDEPGGDAFGEESGDGNGDGDDPGSDEPGGVSEGDGEDGPGSAEGEKQVGDAGSGQSGSANGDDGGLGVLPIVGIVGLVLAAVGAGTLYVFRSRGAF